jgi:hypothetical protein
MKSYWPGAIATPFCTASSFKRKGKLPASLGLMPILAALLQLLESKLKIIGIYSVPEINTPYICFKDIASIEFASIYPDFVISR